MGSIAAKILSFLAFISIAFSFFLFSSLTSSPGGGGLGLLALVAIIGLMAFGAWFIGNIFGVLAIVLSRRTRDVFTGVMLILISILHLFPVVSGIREFLVGYRMGFNEFFIVIVLGAIMVMYFVAGLNRVRGG